MCIRDRAGTVQPGPVTTVQPPLRPSLWLCWFLRLPAPPTLPGLSWLCKPGVGGGPELRSAAR
eukprot:1070609-Alexandrium_andersonii.AAC.1